MSDESQGLHARFRQGCLIEGCLTLAVLGLDWLSGWRLLTPWIRGSVECVGKEVGKEFNP
jgi:hypothetical protein